MYDCTRAERVHFKTTQFISKKEKTLFSQIHTYSSSFNVQLLYSFENAEFWTHRKLYIRFPLLRKFGICWYKVFISYVIIISIHRFQWQTLIPSIFSSCCFSNQLSSVSSSETFLPECDEIRIQKNTVMQNEIKIL